MKNLKPIYWHQGLFLQPQHFQLSDLYSQSMLMPYLKHLNPHLWGVGRLKMDMEALADGTFVLREGTVVFPDGAMVDFPGNGVVQPRTIDETLLTQGRPFKVFLGLSKWDDNAPNVTVLSGLHDVSGVNTRFATTADPEEFPDLFGDGPLAKVKRLTYVPKIFWESERDQLSKYDLVAVAEITPDLEEIKLSQNFIPPALQIDASVELLGIVKDIYDKSAARCRRLEEYKTPRGVKTQGMDPGVFFLMMGLRTISRYVLPLGRMLDAKNTHPWDAFNFLVQMVGELSTFSQRISALGEDEAGKPVVPRYKHDDLASCFSALEKLIGALLDEITFGPESIIRLKYEDPYYVGLMEAGVFDARNNFYLSINTETSHKEVAEAIDSVAKLSARENLEILISRSLPGLRLEYVPIPPPGLPQIATTAYFKVDAAGAQWDDIRRMGNIALFWDTAPQDMVAELIVLRRA